MACAGFDDQLTFPASTSRVELSQALERRLTGFEIRARGQFLGSPMHCKLSISRSPDQLGW